MTWPAGRSRDGGIDEIPLPDTTPGHLWLCGKHAIGPDPAGAIARTRSPAATVVCLVERHEIADRYPDYVAWLDDPATDTVWWPIPDMHAPAVAEMAARTNDLATRLIDGKTLIVHCGAGFGRAGTTAACVLVQLGMAADQAVSLVGQSRPLAGPEVGTQMALVNDLDHLLDGGPMARRERLRSGGGG